MPPARLDLKEASCANTNMLLSPGLSLRRVASSNAAERGPLSSTSSRFNSIPLMASPPPSPGLPALGPRHRRPVPLHAPRRCLRAFLWLSGVSLILYYGIARIRMDRPFAAVGWAPYAADQYEMVSDEQLPDFPTPVVVSDKRGRAKWTVSIPPDQEFPLPPRQYAEICGQSMEVAKHVRDLHKHVQHGHGAHFDYYHVDKNFMDVAEAEAHGLLLKTKDGSPTKSPCSIVGVKANASSERRVCEKTMTFVLETSNAGLGKTLMMLWTAYGLAKKEGREFFIDDSRWVYGNYTTFFTPPPLPSCLPPPRTHILPCPHHVRHLLVSAATTTSTFGGSFNNYYEDARKMEVFRQKPIFSFARLGYEALFHLSAPDSAYLTTRLASLRAQTVVDPAESSHNGTIIGIHVRHGDRHPLEFQYRDSYVPLDRYITEARTMLRAQFNASAAEIGDTSAMMKSIFIAASDDPLVYATPEFSNVVMAQERIRLAAKPTVDASVSATIGRRSPGARKFVDEQVGWEGGFYAAMFWSLGQPAAAKGTVGALIAQASAQAQASREVMRLRELVGRAYLLDLAVLGQASERVVCTVSSTACKLLAVMMGWENAIERGWWVNVDGTFPWSGVAW